jgi:hypothetical protein
MSKAHASLKDWRVAYFRGYHYTPPPQAGRGRSYRACR